MARHLWQLLKRSKSKAAKRQSTLPGGLQDDDDVIPSRSESPAPTRRSQDLALSLLDILRTLTAQYIRMSTSNRARAAIAVCRGTLLEKLGRRRWKETYLVILENLAIALLGHGNIVNNRYRLLISRRMVDSIVQEVVGKRILGESGQTAAAKSIVNDILKNYPQALKEKPEPTKIYPDHRHGGSGMPHRQPGLGCEQLRGRVPRWSATGATTSQLFGSGLYLIVPEEVRIGMPAAASFMPFRLHE